MRWTAVILGGILGLLAPSAQALVVDRIVAVVNEEIITLSELQEEALRIRALPREALSDRMRLYPVLRRMIEARLLVQTARRKGLQVSDAELDAAIEDIKQANRLTDEAFREALREEGITLEEYRKRLAEEILRARILEKEVRSRVVVSDAEIQTYYQSHRERFRVPREIRVRHLLLPLAPEAPPEEVRRVMEKAEALKARIEAGDDFARLAREYSRDPSAPYGGDLGFIRRGTLEPAFESVVFSLKPGQIGGPIRTPHGVHLVRVEAVRGGGVKPLSEVREDILRLLQEQKADAYYESWIRDIKLRAYIDFKL